MSPDDVLSPYGFAVCNGARIPRFQKLMIIATQARAEKLWGSAIRTAVAAFFAYDQV